MASSSAAVEAILAAACAGGLDETLLGYFVGAISENTEHIHTEEELYETIGELLVGYGVCGDEGEAKKINAKIFRELVEKKIVTTSAKEALLLEAPRTMQPLTTGDVIDPFVAEPSAVALGQQMLVNTADGLPSEVSIKSTKTRLAREAKESQHQATLRSWAESDSQKAAEKALPMYLEALALRTGASTDVNIGEFTLLKPEKTVPLIENGALRLVTGRRYGLVGRNGVGKTTLLRAISRYEIAEFPRHLRVLHVEQEVRGGTETALSCVMAADLERTMLLEEETQLRALVSQEGGVPAGAAEAAQARLAVVYARLNEIESWSAEGRAAAILTGLQVTREMQAMPTKQLSGGWRMRVALACALFVNPDILLLDEPTNHLDFPAVIWLTEHLRAHSKTLIVVSHDRTFLNEVVTDIMHLHKKQILYYRGDFNNFLKVQEELLIARKREYEAQQKEIAHMEAFVDRFYNEKRSAAQNSRVGQAMSRKKALEKMERLEDPSKDQDADSISLRFPEPDQLKKAMLVQADSIDIGYPGGATLVSGITLQVTMGSRIGIIGSNGCGKSTLIKALLGDLQPKSGSLFVNGGARFALFAQHHMDQIDLHQTPVECLREKFPGTPIQECRDFLGRFGIRDEMATLQMGHLSGGQKSRVVFSILTRRCPHVLVLDEPTNHLDMETIDVLIDAIRHFQGAVLLVSHDQYFLSQAATEFWTIRDGRFKACDSLAAAKAFSFPSL
eukprot:m.136397 g.136397  ORF g.136397 m.136397 type:complete len:732 (+) comp14888_c2_seq1:80-2275(+)